MVSKAYTYGVKFLKVVGPPLLSPRPRPPLLPGPPPPPPRISRRCTLPHPSLLADDANHSWSFEAIRLRLVEYNISVFLYPIFQLNLTGRSGVDGEGFGSPTFSDVSVAGTPSKLHHPDSCPRALHPALVGLCYGCKIVFNGYLCWR